MKTTKAISTMDFLLTDRRLFAKIAEYQKYERNKILFAIVGLNICLPNISKKEVDQLIKDNFRGGKDLTIMKGGKYYILMKDTSVEVAERAVNRLKTKLSFISINFRCLKDSKRFQAAAFILGTSRIKRIIKCKHVDLTSTSNFSSKQTPIMNFGLKEYLKCSVITNSYNHLNNSLVNIVV
ncbi:MAG: hypothetical protein PVI18_08575 [Desulfobacterales bacterium]|jgi:hypothetical protein